MFNATELYEYLIEFDPITESDKMIWQGLATKLWLDLKDENSNKMFDVIEKAQRYEIIVPEPEMVSTWQFLKDNQSKISSPEDLEKLVLEYGLTTTTSNTGSIDI
jgi:hypothetical protein